MIKLLLLLAVAAAGSETLADRHRAGEPLDLVPSPAGTGVAIEQPDDPPVADIEQPDDPPVAELLLFWDDFESGDASAWLVCCP